MDKAEIVFEKLAGNLLKVVKRFGKDLSGKSVAAAKKSEDWLYTSRAYGGKNIGGKSLLRATKHVEDAEKRQLWARTGTAIAGSAGLVAAGIPLFGKKEKKKEE